MDVNSGFHKVWGVAQGLNNMSTSNKKNNCYVCIWKKIGTVTNKDTYICIHSAFWLYAFQKLWYFIKEETYLVNLNCSAAMQVKVSKCLTIQAEADGRI